METGEAAKIVQPVYKADVSNCSMISIWSIQFSTNVVEDFWSLINVKHRVVASVLFEGVVVPFFLKVAAEMETGEAPKIVQPVYKADVINCSMISFEAFWI